MPGRVNAGPALVPAEDLSPRSPEVALLAQVLSMQLAAGDAWTKLTEAGIDCIMLKGPAIASWLYDKTEIRPSRDIDLMVAPADVQPAKNALAQLGYAAWLERPAPCEGAPNEEALFGPNGVMIDLHHRLIGIPGPRARCWHVLSRHTTHLELRTGTVVQVLDIPARTMHLALHAAQSGRADVKACTDLERGLAQVPFGQWQAAAAIARQLDAVAAFAAGLRLSHQGAALAERLQLPDRCDVELALRIAEAPQESIFLERLANTPGTAHKLAIVARKIWPTRGYLQAQSPVAQNGALGLLRARLDRQASLLRRTGPAVAAWWRIRRGSPGGPRP